jgi:hypothetical protein
MSKRNGIGRRMSRLGYGLLGFAVAACSQAAQPESEASPNDLGSNERVAGSSDVDTGLAAGSAAKEWTLAVYLASETLSDIHAIEDINALERRYAEWAPFMDIVVLADGGFESAESNWPERTRILRIRADDTDKVVSEITPPPDTEIARLLAENDDELYLSSPDVLKAFLDYVQRDYSSKYLAVNIHDHGSAWEGAVLDYVDGDISVTAGPMRPSQFSDVFATLSRPIDVLGFDACLMQEMSVNTFMHTTGKVKYVVASEQLQIAPGWVWDNIARRFTERRRLEGTLTPLAHATEIVAAFDDEGDFQQNDTISALDLGAWSDVLRSLDQLGAALLEAGSMNDPSVRRVVDELAPRRYGSQIGNPSTFSNEDLVDVIGFCRLIEEAFDPSSAVNQAAAELRVTVERSIVLSKTRDSISSGLTMHLPRTGTRPEVNQAAFEKLSAPVLSLTPSWQAFLRSI